MTESEELKPCEKCGCTPYYNATKAEYVCPFCERELQEYTSNIERNLARDRWNKRNHRTEEHGTD